MQVRLFVNASGSVNVRGVGRGGGDAYLDSKLQSKYLPLAITAITMTSIAAATMPQQQAACSSINTEEAMTGGGLKTVELTLFN